MLRNYEDDIIKDKFSREVITKLTNINYSDLTEEGIINALLAVYEWLLEKINI